MYFGCLVVLGITAIVLLQGIKEGFYPTSAGTMLQLGSSSTEALPTVDGECQHDYWFARIFDDRMRPNRTLVRA